MARLSAGRACVILLGVATLACGRAPDNAQRVVVLGSTAWTTG
jgi:hypothetical protein